MIADHGACRIGMCRHGHVDFCPAQKGYRKPREKKAPAPVGLVLEIIRDDGGNNIGMVSSGIQKGGKYAGMKYTFDARNEIGEKQLLKAVSVMLKNYHPVTIADMIKDIRDGK